LGSSFTGTFAGGRVAIGPDDDVFCVGIGLGGAGGRDGGTGLGGDGWDADGAGAVLRASCGGAGVTFVGTFSPSPNAVGFVAPGVALAIGRAAGFGGGTLLGCSPSGRSAVSGFSGGALTGAPTIGMPITVGVVERALRMTRPFDHNSSV
jgi:hypothetical protein